MKSEKDHLKIVTVSQLMYNVMWWY